MTNKTRLSNLKKLSFPCLQSSLSPTNPLTAIIHLKPNHPNPLVRDKLSKEHLKDSSILPMKIRFVDALLNPKSNKNLFKKLTKSACRNTIEFWKRYLMGLTFLTEVKSVKQISTNGFQNLLFTFQAEFFKKSDKKDSILLKVSSFSFVFQFCILQANKT